MAFQVKHGVRSRMVSEVGWLVYIDSHPKTFEHKIVNIFLSVSFSINFGCSKEPSH